MKILNFLTILLLLKSEFVFAQDVKNYIPPQAFKYKDIINSEITQYFPNIPTKNYIPALAEHESCISLTNKKCWNSFSQLKSKREEGGGIFQVTRAYNKDGTIRFDSLSNMQRTYKQDLKEANWGIIYQRPDIQIRIGVLMVRDDYKKLYNVSNEMNRLQMTDSSYNGGLKAVLDARRACGMALNCDPNIWFGNVEKYLNKSRKPIYGTRSPYDINTHHVEDVFHYRLPKYELKYFTKDDYVKEK
jgi:hypothetical protein